MFGGPDNKHSLLLADMGMLAEEVRQDSKHLQLSSLTSPQCVVLERLWGLCRS